MSERNVKCNKCGYVGPQSSFKTGNDFFQNSFISGCPKCDNRQSPGDASMRMFGGERPFIFTDLPCSKEMGTPIAEVFLNASQAS